MPPIRPALAQRTVSCSPRPIVLPFAPPVRHRQTSEPCIFCGQTTHIQFFKGKAVCHICLQRIPGIFSCG